MSSNWLSNLPDGWDAISLKRVTELKNIRVNGNSYSENYIGLENIESWTGRLITFETSEALTQDEESKSGVVSSFDAGDILFGKLRPYLAKAYLAQSNGICTTELLVLKPIRMIGRYLLYVILTNEFIDQVNSTTFGARMPRADWDDIGSILVPVPVVSDQRAIADFLDRELIQIDSLITAKERLLELLTEKRRAVITHAVTRGLNGDVSLRDSGVEWLDKIPAHWTGTVLKRWLETKITDGPHQTPEHVEDGVPFVSAEAVQGGSINFDSRWGNISRELHERYSKKLLPKRNDIFVVKSGATTGKVAFVDTDIEFNVWSPLALIRANTKMVLPKFLFVIMQSDYVQKQIQMTWTAGTQPNISMGTIEELYVVAPSVEEQKLILERLYEQLRNIDRLTALAQKTIENLHERRASLIAAVVSGQIKVV